MDRGRGAPPPAIPGAAPRQGAHRGGAGNPGGPIVNKQSVKKQSVNKQRGTGDTLTAGGITVELSHTGKVFYPDDGITKGDLIEHYHAVAGRMLPYLKDRPVSMARYPDGITGHRIFQKNVPDYFPDWITRA